LQLRHPHANQWLDGLDVVVPDVEQGEMGEVDVGNIPNDLAVAVLHYAIEQKLLRRSSTIAHSRMLVMASSSS
jgi:hypothetical protein